MRKLRSRDVDSFASNHTARKNGAGDMAQWIQASLDHSVRLHSIENVGEMPIVVIFKDARKALCHTEWFP